jgi:hypothetical protein
VNTESKIVHLSTFSILFIGGAVIILSCVRNNEAAVTATKIKFSAAQFETNGNLKIEYRYTTPSGVCLLEANFENGAVTAESKGSSGGVRDSSSGYSVSVQNIPTPSPSLLVTTGKTYYLNLRDHAVLPMYSFTNNSGRTYHGELSLRR